MKKLLILSIAGILCASLSTISSSAVAAATSPQASKAQPQKSSKRHVSKRKAKSTAAKTDPVPANAVKWSCEDGQSFMLQGNMERDQIVTLHWGNKNYKLPRQQTSTGADRFYDAASHLDLVVIPTKAMLFSDKDSSRLADECKTVAMTQGAFAPTQSNALKRP